MADASAADPEPTLKYQRLGGSVGAILAKDAAACLAVHAKFLALGTSAGAVHVLDLGGNEIRRFLPHSARVTDICIDSTGEFVGSCSQDGTVVVSSLFGGESSTHWYHRPVRAIALDPEYASRRVFATGGLAAQLIINSKGWFGSKDNVVHSGEGAVQAIAMAGPMLAWANDLGVKVYDAQHARRVSFIENAPGSPPPELFRYHLRWQTTTELIIGRADTIKIGRVREREPPACGMGGCNTPSGCTSLGVGASTSGAHGVYMEIHTLIQAEFYICGLGGAMLRVERGMPQHDLLLLAYVCEPADEERYGLGGAPPGGAQRPELRLLSRHNEELFSDALSIDGFENHKCGSYSLVLAPQAAPQPDTLYGGGADAGHAHAAACSTGLDARSDAAGVDEWHEEGAALSLPELTAYIVSPSEIVVARSRDVDDRVGWLLARGRVEAALQMATRQEHLLREHNVTDIAEVYIGSLLRTGQSRAAADMCATHLRDSAELWTKWLRAFCASGALPHLAPHVPLSSPQLTPEAYEGALCSAIAPAADGSSGPGVQLLELLRQWPPHVYRPAVVQSALLEAARKLPGGLLGQPRLMESMALLHCHAKQHEAALKLLLQLPAHEIDLFAFIELHSAHAHCRDKVWAIASHSWPKTLAMLIRYTEAIQPADVVAQLEAGDVSGGARTAVTGGKNGDGRSGSHGRRWLFEYLHELFVHDVHLGAPFHGQLLTLYGEFAPELLLPFLKGSPHYPLEVALDVCSQRRLVEGQVYLLGRMGAHREALALMLEEMDDVKGAIDYVKAEGLKAHGAAVKAVEELWQDLLRRAFARPEHVEAVLEHVSAEPLRTLDTVELVRQLPGELTVGSGKRSRRLAALLTQAASEFEMVDSAVSVSEADCLALLRKKHMLLQSGTPTEIGAQTPRPRAPAERFDLLPAV